LREAARAARAASDFLGLERISRELVALGESTGDLESAAFGYYHLGIALSNLNRGDDAARATQSAIDLYERAGDRFSVAKAMMNLGSIELDNHGNAAEARRLIEASMPVVREFGEPVHTAIALGNLAEICRLDGDYRAALRDAEEALAIFSSMNDVDNTIWQLTNIAHFQLQLRKYDEALLAMRDAYELLSLNPNPRWFAWYFDTYFLIAAGLDRLDIAAQLLAFTDKYRDEQNQPRMQAMLPWLSTPKERLAREMTHERHDELVAAGEALTVEAAQGLAETIR
jgi:tetratricopeptide (TPR) repeat protein